MDQYTQLLTAQERSPEQSIQLLRAQESAFRWRSSGCSQLRRAHSEGVIPAVQSSGEESGPVYSVAHSSGEESGALYAVVQSSERAFRRRNFSCSQLRRGVWSSNISLSELSKAFQARMRTVDDAHPRQTAQNATYRSKDLADHPLCDRLVLTNVGFNQRWF